MSAPVSKMQTVEWKFVVKMQYNTRSLYNGLKVMVTSVDTKQDPETLYWIRFSHFDVVLLLGGFAFFTGQWIRECPIYEFMSVRTSSDDTSISTCGLRC